MDDDEIDEFSQTEWVDKGGGWNVAVKAWKHSYYTGIVECPLCCQLHACYQSLRNCRL
jgi:hypothetical protein